MLFRSRAVPRQYSVTVRLHLAPDNRKKLPEFIDGFKRDFGNDHRFGLFLRTLTHLGGPNNAQTAVFDREQGREAVRSLKKYAEKLNVRHFTVEEQSPVCYAASGNSFVVRADGRINKCTVSLEHPNNQVGSIQDDGDLLLDVSRIVMWKIGRAHV